MDFYQNVNKTDVKKLIGLLKNDESCNLLLGRGAFGSVQWAPDNRAEINKKWITLVHKTRDEADLHIDKNMISEFLMEVIMTSKLTELCFTVCPCFPVIHNVSLCGNGSSTGLEKYGSYDKNGNMLNDLWGLYEWLHPNITDRVCDYIAISCLFSCYHLEMNKIQLMDIHPGNFSFQEIEEREVEFKIGNKSFVFKQNFILKFIDTSIGTYKGYIVKRYPLLDKIKNDNNYTIIFCIKILYPIFSKGKYMKFLFDQLKDFPNEIVFKLNKKKIETKKSLFDKCYDIK